MNKLMKTAAALLLTCGAALAQSPVSPPVVTPAPGPFTGTVTITITDATPQARIYYTTDGSTPTSSSNRYTQPFTLNATKTVKAIAMYSMPNSPVVSGTYTLNTTPPPLPCLNSTNTWVNAALGATQTAAFRVSFDATPSAVKIDSVTGLSLGKATTYPNLAAAVRFNDTGFIDAMNGVNFYQSLIPIPYTAGTVYHFTLDVNLPAHVYTAIVNGVVIGTNYAFRTEQATASSVDTLNVFASTGSEKACNIAISPYVAPPVVTAHSVTLTWQEVPPTPKYFVYRSQVAGGPYTNIATATTITYKDLAVVSGQKYFYTVTAVDAQSNESGKSSEVSATIP